MLLCATILIQNSAPAVSCLVRMRSTFSDRDIDTMKKYLLRCGIGIISVFVLLFLSFGPAWGLYKRGYLSKPIVTALYGPLIRFANERNPPFEWVGGLVYSYAEFCAPVVYQKSCCSYLTFD